MRRLTQFGCLPLKRSAYLLPAGDAALEDLQWLLREIRADGGEAWIVEGRFAGGVTDDEIRGRFRDLRAAEYRQIAADARAVVERVRAQPAAEDGTLDAERRRLTRRLDAAKRTDFFDADGRDEVETLMATIDRLAGGADPKRPPIDRDDLHARTWITRAGVKVDRMASAWLIRRFIDPAATFEFMAPDAAPPGTGAIRFDTFEGEFTHDGNRCTFEVLVEASGLADDPGLTALAAIVHDLDLRDDKYQRPETAGIGALIEGIVARFADDRRRLAESAPLFDTLYASFGGRHVNRSSPEK